jgi:hypothetical protein
VSSLTTDRPVSFCISGEGFSSSAIAESVEKRLSAKKQAINRVFIWVKKKDVDESFINIDAHNRFSTH